MAAEWIQLDTNLYAHASSIRKYNGHVYNKSNLYTILLKWLNNKSNKWQEMEADAGKKLWYNVQLVVIDCKNNEFAIRSVAYYDLTENLIGRLIAEDSDLEWYSFIPDTVSETIYDFVCSAVLNQ